MRYERRSGAAPDTTMPTSLEPTTRLQFLPGIGPARARLFEKLDLFTLEQLVRHYPRTWLDARKFVPIASIAPGEIVTAEGTVRHAAALRTRSGRTDFAITLEDGGARLGCYFFGQPFLARTLKPGLRLVVSGELDPNERRMVNPMFEVLEGEVAELLHVGRLVPVHGLTRGITARGMRSAVRAALDAVAGRIPDALPPAAAAGFPGLDQALSAIHFPEDEAEREAARQRLAFEEFFMLQCVMRLRRRALDEQGRGLAHAGSGALAAAAERALPFRLTDDQRRALAEIVADLRAPRSMQRMLLGDVGSGKTVVATLAALHVIESGHQVAFMAPTEILARQHAATLERVCGPAGAAVATLTGATPAAARRALAVRLAAGEPMIVIGTHALIEDKVEIPKLGLAIVDEQHRFGVRQRAALAQKGVIPDVLVLTATPIPRTLQLASYGDLDFSLLHARPAGRGRLVTRIADEARFPQVVEFMAKELSAGRQAFVVLPLIEQAERSALRAAEAEHRRLASHPLLSKWRVGLLHGRMKADEKQAMMDGFVRGEVQVLVSTTVVEVGVDVPNATLMVVENAERFGLTQLHQLRGRVGRGEHRSVCVLVPGAGAGGIARRRLEVLARTDDGFEIAEADLKLRGPGDVWGMRQSGFSRFRLADLALDGALLERAREAAGAVVAADPHLLSPPNANLKSALLEGWGEALKVVALAG